MVSSATKPIDIRKLYRLLKDNTTKIGAEKIQQKAL